MNLSPRLRYAVPAGAAVVTAIAVAMPQAASGSDQPKLPAKTAAQLLASIEQSKVPSFTGTVVETARLGLPSIDTGSLGISAGSASQVQQVVALLTGSHTAHLAYAGPDKQRLAVFMDDLSETDVVHDGKDLWTYQSSGNSYDHTTLSEPQQKSTKESVQSTMDPTQAAQKALAEIDPSTTVTVDRTARVAGRAAYQLVLAPKDANSLVGSVRIAVDSATSMPLRVQIFPRSSATTPAFEVGFTSLDLSTPSDATFHFTPPAGSVNSATIKAPAEHRIKRDGKLVATVPVPEQAPDAAKGETTLGKDWSTVYVAKGTQTAGLGDNLDQLAQTVPAGHLISTSLLSVLVTKDGRTLIGAVTPAYLEQLAAS